MVPLKLLIDAFMFSLVWEFIFRLLTNISLHVGCLHISTRPSLDWVRLGLGLAPFHNLCCMTESRATETTEKHNETHEDKRGQLKNK